MSIIVDERVQLTEIRPADKPAFVVHLNDRDIYERTLRIPYPYTEAEADAFLKHVAESTERQGQPTHWALRNEREELIGGLGFTDFEIGSSHRAEIGYWLAKPYWGQGIMTAAVRAACAFACDEWELVKIVAHVFVNNPASARVLEKNGFVQEGYLRKHLRKDGRYLDALLFGLLAESHETSVPAESGSSRAGG